MATSLTSAGVRFPDNSVQSAPAFTIFRNRIINGDMRISQRGTSFAVANAYPYTLDRFGCGFSGTSAATITQNADVPAGSGLANSLRVTVTTADTSIAAGDHSFFYQIIEGYNAADLVGVPITLSFWVRSSKTGIHCVRFSNSVEDRSYVSEYTISSSDTWEKKSITVANGLITSGTWNFTNGKGLMLAWALAFGTTWQTSTPNTWALGNLYTTPNQVNCLDTVGNIFAVTGVQLEKGSTATDFEFRSYSVEIALCQRYYERRTVGSQNNERIGTAGLAASNTIAQIPIQHLVQKRSIPTIVVANLGSTIVYDGAGITTPTSWGLDNTGIYITNITIYGISTVLGRAIHWCWKNVNPLPYIEINSEI